MTKFRARAKPPAFNAKAKEPAPQDPDRLPPTFSSEDMVDADGYIVSVAAMLRIGPP
jgi:hypothetical protein